MSYVHILKSISTGKYYIGCTERLNRRIAEHNSGKVQSTKALRPLKKVLIQNYATLSQARQVERRLKNFKRKEFIEKIVKNGYIKLNTRAYSSVGRAFH